MSQNELLLVDSETTAGDYPSALCDSYRVNVMANAGAAVGRLLRERLMHLLLRAARRVFTLTADRIPLPTGR